MAGLAPASLPPVRATVVRSILIDAAQVTVGAARRTRAVVFLERAVTSFRRVLLTRHGRWRLESLRKAVRSRRCVIITRNWRNRKIVEATLVR